MNQVDMQCNNCQHTWRWLSGTPLICPCCRQVVQITTLSRNGYYQHTEKWTENQACKKRKLGKVETRRQDPRRIDPSSYEVLTQREQEVLGLVAQGNSNEAVAEQLVITVRTVENHLHNIYGKIYVHSRTEAAVWAIEKGIVRVR